MSELQGENLQGGRYPEGEKSEIVITSADGRFVVKRHFSDEMPPELRQGNEKEVTDYLVIELDGKVFDVRCSTMEPEDTTFDRDLNWVAPLLVVAYNRGYLHALQAQLVEEKRTNAELRRALGT